MIKNKNKRLIITIFFLDSLISLFWLFLIPSDPKNDFLFGYSKFRWFQGFIVLIGTSILFFYFSNPLISNHVKKFTSKIITEQLRQIIGLTCFVILLIVLMTPGYRLSPYSAEFIRFKPILFWFLSIGVIDYFIWLFQVKRKNFENIQIDRVWIKNLSYIFLLLLIPIGLWFFLDKFSNGLQINNLVFSPPAPITTLQMFILIVIFILIFSKNNENGNKWLKKNWVPFLIFVITFVVWYSIPISCTNDLIGPFPPNNLCYPKSDDAVYSIASHYGRLGNGIYNHWFTDKPLYIFFLMVLQWISSPKISDYLTIQIMVFALVPTVAFIFVRRIFNWKYSLFLSILLIVHEINQITGYQYFGGVNSKFEATEIFTALILLLFTIISFYWFISPNKKFLAIFSGGILGLASLTRLNPLFIIPFVLFLVFIANIKNFKNSIIISFLFILGFASVFSPWYVFSVDHNGQNFLFRKIEDVIGTRYQYFNKKDLEPQSTINEKEVSIKIDPFILSNIEQEENNRVDKVLFHFANNLYQNLFILPSSFTFDTLENISNNPIWKDQEGSPIWKYSLTIQNITIIIINLLIIYIGIWKTISKYRISGLVPLFTQFGYILGNSLALTSGNRYLLPVLWITFFYYTIGLIWIIKYLLKFFSINIDDNENNFQQVKLPSLLTSNFLYILFVMFAVLSFGLTQLNLIPDRIPENTENLTESQSELLKKYIVLEDIEKYFEINNIKIYQGVSYQPKYYRNYFYNDAPESFELVTLTNDEVVVSYIRNFPMEYFSDESETTIIGCPLKEENRWGAKFIILDALIIFQNNFENSLLISPKLDVGCKEPMN